MGEKLGPVQQLLQAEMKARKIPALAVAIARRDRLVYDDAFGLLDLENAVPAKPSTRFRLASLAKPVTAVAVMQLVEKGKIALDAGIHEYVPAFPAKPAKVTVRHLLGHLGGIRHYDRARGEMESTRHYNDVVAALEIFANDPLVHPPGSKYLYTTYGYNLLGAAVQEVADIPYVDYVRQNILAPGRLRDVVPDDHFAIVPNRARGYLRRSDGVVVNAALADTSNKIPGGGWLGTASDLARFALAFRQCRFTRRDTVELMLRTQRTTTGVPTGYGMGWQIFNYGDRRIPPDQRIAGHTGAQPGTNTFLGMTMDGSWTICLLTNLEGGDPRTIAEPLFDILRGAPPPAQAKNEPQRKGI